jgi:hypothetical protein
MELPHSEVHNNTKKIFEQLNDHGNQQEILKHIEMMEIGSKGVFEFLDKILKEKTN